MALNTVLFWILAVTTGFCAIAVVVTQNIVRSATWLLFTLAGVSGIFFLLGADFVGATQLLVYVGGTLVLVVFGVMLTAQGPFITMKTGAAEWAVSMVVGLVFFTVLVVSVVGATWPKATPRDPTDQMENAQKSRSSTRLGLAFLGFQEATPDAKLTGVPGGPGRAQTAQAAPRARRKMAYLFPFEIISVHLLVVLLGAAYLARAKRRRVAPLAPQGRGVEGQGNS
jgi:NADH-quinone oxidoreductase subunit J